MSKTSLTVVRLPHISAGLTLINSGFLQIARKLSAKLIKTPQLQTESGEFVNIEGIVPLFIRPGHLHLGALFGFVKNLAVDELLGTSFVYQCIRLIFLAEQKRVR